MFQILATSLPLFLILGCLLSTNISQFSFGQSIENWQTYVDPDKKFTLFYPPGWQAKGKQNFLSSVDLTLTKANSTRPFQVTISYTLNDSSLNYTGNARVMPEKDLLNLEEQSKPAYQIYNIVEKNLGSYNLYGFPTVDNLVDYRKYDGESGRTLNVLGIVNAKNSFLLSYSNSIEAFYKDLQTVNEIIKSIVILK